jgi:hypothetical protein
MQSNTTKPGDFGMYLKVTVKQRLIVFHDPSQWSEIFQRIQQEFGKGMLVRARISRELGFVPRHHKGIVPNDSVYMQAYCATHHYAEQVHLDFFSDSAQSWFQLRYL